MDQVLFFSPCFLSQPQFCLGCPYHPFGVVNIDPKAQKLPGSMCLDQCPLLLENTLAMPSHPCRVCNVNRNRFFSLVPASLSALILIPTLLAVLPAAPSTRPPMTCDHLSCCAAFPWLQSPPRLTLTPGCYKLVVALQSPALAWPPSNGMVWLGVALIPGTSCVHPTLPGSPRTDATQKGSHVNSP